MRSPARIWIRSRLGSAVDEEHLARDAADLHAFNVSIAEEDIRGGLALMAKADEGIPEAGIAIVLLVEGILSRIAGSLCGCQRRWPSGRSDQNCRGADRRSRVHPTTYCHRPWEVTRRRRCCCSNPSWSECHPKAVPWRTSPSRLRASDASQDCRASMDRYHSHREADENFPRNGRRNWASTTCSRYLEEPAAPGQRRTEVILRSLEPSGSITLASPPSVSVTATHQVVSSFDWTASE